MIALSWHLRRRVRALRWQGVAGVGLIAAAAAVYFTGIGPGQVQLSQLQQEALSVRDFARKAGGAADGPPPTQEAWLERFYRLLPVRASALDWLRIIFSTARDQSLTLEQGDYKMRVDKNGRLVAYEISLPVRGTYVGIRRFIAAVLEQIPAVALDELVVKREAAGDPRIEASIRFTLFLNGS